MIICIERECGSGAHVVAEHLSRIYSLPLYDRQSLIREAKTTGVYDQMKKFFEERPTENSYLSISKGDESPEFGRELYEMFRELIEPESFILIGRCGNYIYRKRRDEMVSIFLHAEINDRVKRTMKKQHLDRWNAGKIVDEVDDKRRAFHKYYTGTTWGMAADYDLCLNTSYLGIPGAVHMINEYIDAKFGEK
ncbi:MAG: cytidylate kinase-like family protein [Lachnospiraceae bacterium]|nr:cytidylate kinase-like family protein [Lachnospiraceae bacterium]